MTVLAFFSIAVATAPAIAEDVENKFRLGFMLGGFTPQDEIPSDAANVLQLFNRDFTLAQIYIDPRNDSSVFGTLEIKPGQIGFLNAQYAVNKVFMIEGAVGYTKTDIGRVEVQAQFDQVVVDENVGFNFATFRINAGDVEMVPIMLSGMARFRPRASFNPYIGGGIGYQLVGYEPSPEFNQLSVNLDNSQGGQAILSGAINGNPSLVPPANSAIGDLQGASVDAPDSFIYQAILGGEWTIKPRWALLVDLRYSFSSKGVRIGFNGGEDLGIRVPFVTDFIDQPIAQQTFGAVRITDGGLIDGGGLRPAPGQPVNTNCATSPTLCIFDPALKDGVVDPGFYYINGGNVDYSTFFFTVGLRYTFK